LQEQVIHSSYLPAPYNNQCTALNVYMHILTIIIVIALLYCILLHIYVLFTEFGHIWLPSTHSPMDPYQWAGT
jgi:hypothetical protein